MSRLHGLREAAEDVLYPHAPTGGSGNPILPTWKKVDDSDFFSRLCALPPRHCTPAHPPHTGASHGPPHLGYRSRQSCSSGWRHHRTPQQYWKRAACCSPEDNVQGRGPRAQKSEGTRPSAMVSSTRPVNVERRPWQIGSTPGGYAVNT